MNGGTERGFFEGDIIDQYGVTTFREIHAATITPPSIEIKARTSSLDRRYLRNKIKEFEKIDMTKTEKLAGVSIMEITRSNLIMSISMNSPDIIYELVDRNKSFEDIDVSKLNEKIMYLANNASTDVLNSLSNSEELKRRIEKIMVTESMILAFKELTPEQRELFD